jgi:hypothetical protein
MNNDSHFRIHVHATLCNNLFQFLGTFELQEVIITKQVLEKDVLRTWHMPKSQPRSTLLNITSELFGGSDIDNYSVCGITLSN